MREKYIKYSVLIFALTILLGVGLVLKIKSNNNVISTANNKIKIAACPSCYELVDKLDSKKYSIIKTNSTSESIALLENEVVDYILAGRTLRPEEPKLDSFVIQEGYSFLSPTEQVITKESLADFDMYTDLDVDKMKTLFALEKVTSVDDVYEYMDKGIVITSWDNTDYSRANIVHVLETENKRLALSRRPTLYCPPPCDENILLDIYSVELD